MGLRMINPAGMELLEWIQASAGWTLLAARASKPDSATAVDAISPRSEASPTAPLRLRATITIDIDARDADEAERQCEAIRAQFELLKLSHPAAVLAFQRRKPRTSRRPLAPSIVVTPYADD